MAPKSRKMPKRCRAIENRCVVRGCLIAFCDRTIAGGKLFHVGLFGQFQENNRPTSEKLSKSGMVILINSLLPDVIF